MKSIADILANMNAQAETKPGHRKVHEIAIAGAWTATVLEAPNLDAERPYHLQVIGTHDCVGHFKRTDFFPTKIEALMAVAPAFGKTVADLVEHGFIDNEGAAFMLAQATRSIAPVIAETVMEPDQKQDEAA